MHGDESRFSIPSPRPPVYGPWSSVEGRRASPLRLEMDATLCILGAQSELYSAFWNLVVKTRLTRSVRPRDDGTGGWRCSTYLAVMSNQDVP